MRINRDQMFAEMLKVIEKRSTCLRSKVAAIIEKDGRVISIGYNGPASGMPECTPESEYVRLGYSKPVGDMCMGAGCDRSIHAEANAIAFAARAGISIEGATMHCSMSPCINCAKLIINSGIKELCYLESYRDKAGVELLLKSGISVYRLNENGERGELLIVGSRIEEREWRREGWEVVKKNPD